MPRSVASEGDSRSSSAAPTEDPEATHAGTLVEVRAPDLPLERSRAGLAEGDVLAERYRIVRKLGAGGMGEVWEAQHLVLDKRVAIKALVLDRARDEGTRAKRLMREARLVARIEHPNVVEISDFGHTASGLPYFVMELLRGKSLQQVLDEQGALPWIRVVEIAEGIAHGLGAAHAIGVIHRDLKPANVFVLERNRGETCKVIDFGIAKATLVDDHDRTLTRTGLVFGTPSYMSPEQARGETTDGRADIYALGIILHEALTGQRLFGARTPAEIVYRQLFESPSPPGALMPEAGIPGSIDAIVLRCLAKSPANRFQSMQELADALTAARRGELVPLPPPEAPPSPPAALRARYGGVRGQTGSDAVELAPARPVPSPARTRRVLRATGWILGGAALGLALVVGTAIARRDRVRSGPRAREKIEAEQVPSAPVRPVGARPSDAARPEIEPSVAAPLEPPPQIEPVAPAEPPEPRRRRRARKAERDRRAPLDEQPAPEPPNEPAQAAPKGARKDASGLYELFSDTD